MKNLLLFGGLGLSLSAFSQTTIFQDNFEAGSSNWVLNAGTGDNKWVVNSIYAGDLWGGLLVGPTPSQPATFTGGVNSSYLHIHNTMMCLGFMTCNSNFDTESPSDQTAAMSTAISTTGLDNINLTFSYLCGGAAGTSFGKVEYTTDGTTWTALGNELSGVSTWTQITLTDPALSNQASLKFRFRWINGAVGTNPAFSVDEITVTGTNSSVPSIATSAVTSANACFNTAQTVSVPFNAGGVYTSGNIFTAQLSDASGSFSAPQSIGTLASTSGGSLAINASIPAGTPVGSGYRIRVVSSAPAATGTDNGADISVHALPTVAISSVPVNGTINSGQSITLTATGGTDYDWSPTTHITPTGSSATVVANPTSTITYTAAATDANGCTASANVVVTVLASTAEISELPIGQRMVLYPNPATESFEIIHTFTNPITRVEIRDNRGRKIRTYDKPKPEKFMISDLGSGLYSVEVTILDKTYMVRLVIP